MTFKIFWLFRLLIHLFFQSSWHTCDFGTVLHFAETFSRVPRPEVTLGHKYYTLSINKHLADFGEIIPTFFLSSGSFLVFRQDEQCCSFVKIDDN